MFVECANKTAITTIFIIVRITVTATVATVVSQLSSTTVCVKNDNKNDNNNGGKVAYRNRGTESSTIIIHSSPIYSPKLSVSVTKNKRSRS